MRPAMRPGELAAADAFNRADVEALTAFHHPDAVNHQVAEAPVEGAAALREMFARGFAAAAVCIVEHIFEGGGSWNDATRRASAAAASSRSPTAASP